MADESPWLKIAEARQVAKVGARLLYREIKAGRLRAARIGARRDLRIHVDWINEWLEAASTPVQVVVKR